MRLKEAIQHTSGLRCVVEGMEICSSVGRRMLHEMTWLGEESAITAEHDRIASVLRLLETEAGRDRTETIRRKLALLRDIRSTIERTGGNCVFDDIELFELKFFALLAEELRPLALQGHLAELPELNGVVDLLDPEGNRLPISSSMTPTRRSWRPCANRSKHANRPEPTSLKCRSSISAAWKSKTAFGRDSPSNCGNTTKRCNRHSTGWDGSMW